MQTSGSVGGAASISDFLRAGFERLTRLSRNGILRRSPRRLRLCETLSLGNRGFVAVVRYEEQSFLLGGTNSSIALLAQLSPRSRTAQESREDEEK